MRYITKLKLAAIHKDCDDLDTSTEYMFQYMQDVAHVPFETVMNYFNLSVKERKELFKELDELVELMIQLKE